MTWQHNYEPVAGSLGLSALVAAIPILVLFFMLGVQAQAGLDGCDERAGLGTARRARCLRHAGVRWPLISTVYGAAFGIFPIAWIVFSSIMLYRLAVDTGKFEIIKDSVGGLTNDRRLQAMFIAFSFGAFIEGAAGFGAPVAVSGAMLAGLGFNPFYAAGICLLANTAPVAFGSIGIPVITLANVTGLDKLALSSMVGTLCAMVSVIIPGYLIVVMAGVKRALEVLAGHPGVRALVCRHAVLRLELLGPELTDIMSSLTCIVVMVMVLKLWKPKTIMRLEGDKPVTVAAKKHTRRHRSSWHGCRTCCWWCSCWSGVSPISKRRSTGGRHDLLAGLPACERHDVNRSRGSGSAQPDHAHSACDGQAVAVRRGLHAQLAERVGDGLLPGDYRRGDSPSCEAERRS